MSNVATLTRGSLPTNTNQANIQPVYDIYASVQDRDLGSVGRHNAGEYLDQGRFARAVLAHQRMDFARRNDEARP